MAPPKGSKYALGHGCGRPVEWTDELITEEALFLLEWSKDDDSLVLGECYGYRGYSYEDAMDWGNRHNIFRKCKAMAKSIIGARREKGAIKKKYDSGIISKSMGLYDPEYKALLKDLSNHQAIVDAIGEEAAKKLSDLLKSQSAVTK